MSRVIVQKTVKFLSESEKLDVLLNVPDHFTIVAPHRGADAAPVYRSTGSLLAAAVQPDQLGDDTVRGLGHESPQALLRGLPLERGGDAGELLDTYRPPPCSD